MSALGVAPPRLDFFWNTCSTNTKGLELDCGDGPICAPIPILDKLQHASGTETPEGLGLLVLLARLSKVESISKEIHHPGGQRLQITFRTLYPVQRFQGWRLVHLRSLYPYWYKAVVCTG